MGDWDGSRLVRAYATVSPLVQLQKEQERGGKKRITMKMAERLAEARGNKAGSRRGDDGRVELDMALEGRSKEARYRS